MMAKAKIPPRPGKETIYIDVDEDITSIIDKVESAQEKVAALVLPKRATVLQSIVNMRLLKRSADNAGKHVVLITNEEALMPLAGAAGIHVARNLQSAPNVPQAPKEPDQSTKVAEIPVKDKEEITEPKTLDEENLPGKIDYDKPIGELALAHELEHPETIELDDEDVEDINPEAPVETKVSKAKDKKLKIPNYDRFRILLALGVVGLIALIVFVVLAFKVLPKATITVKTSSLPLSANFTLTTSDSAKSLDEAKGIIPASLKASDQSFNETVPATGQQNTGNKATGTVSLANCTNSTVTVPKGTGVSQGGLTYITQASVSLDSGNFDSHGNCKTTGGHIGSTDVTAQQGGAKYNTSLSGANVAGYSGVTASGSVSGGTDNIQTVVSQSDIDTAKGKITSADTDKFTKQFEQQLGSQGYYILTSTLKLSDPATTPNPAVGQPASNVSVAIKITYSVLVIKNDDLKKAITDELNSQMDKSKQQIGTDNVLSGATVTVQDQSSPTAATLNISESTTAVPILDVNKIKQQAVGQKAGNIEATITNIPGVQGVNVKMSPFWVTKAPKASKITVVQQQVKSSSNGN